MKQAKHFASTEGDRLYVHAAPLGGFVVGTNSGRDDFGVSPMSAAFSTADECADWIREFLRTNAAKRFGAKPK